MRCSASFWRILFNVLWKFFPFLFLHDFDVIMWKYSKPICIYIYIWQSHHWCLQASVLLRNSSTIVFFCMYLWFYVRVGAFFPGSLHCHVKVMGRLQWWWWRRSVCGGDDRWWWCAHYGVRTGLPSTHDTAPLLPPASAPCRVHTVHTALHWSYMRCSAQWSCTAQWQWHIGLHHAAVTVQWWGSSAACCDLAVTVTWQVMQWTIPPVKSFFILNSVYTVQSSVCTAISLSRDQFDSDQFIKWTIGILNSLYKQCFFKEEFVCSLDDEVI